VPRLYRVALFAVLGISMLACGLLTRPLTNAKDTVETAQAFASAIPIQTLEALPSAFPSLQAVESAMPGFGDIMNPTGEPVAVWNDIPIMPQATAGGESSMGTYSFKAPVSLDDVKTFYASQLEALGWSQMMAIPGGDQVSIMAYQKDSQVLTITATQQGDEVTVLLALQ
jgi:hypothetical protein